MGVIKVVSDSTLDLPEQLMKELDIEFVPLTVNFGDQFFSDRVGLSSTEFFQRLVESETLPSTSQPSVGMFKEKYLELAEEADYIISIHIAEVLSGTYQSAFRAAQMVEEETEVKIIVIDSKSASLGLGYQVLYAARAIKEGQPLAEIKQGIEERMAAHTVLFTVDTFEYLEKGGRIGKATAFVGNLLNIKPILKLDQEGVVDSYSKVRGKKKLFKKLSSLVKKALEERNLAVGPSLGLVHGQNLEGVQKLKEELEDLSDWEEIIISEISPVIGTHTGPGVLGVVIF